MLTKRSPGEHSHRYNSLDCNEVNIVMSGEKHGKHEVMFHRMANQLKR